MDFKGRIEHTFNKILAQINLTEDLTDFKQIMDYVFLGGKMLRGSLIYQLNQSLQGTQEQADYAACAIEVLHCYTLIHDDLPAMDNDDYRRGKLSCHKKFGEANAILAGDVLQSLSFKAIHEYVQHPNAKFILEHFNKATYQVGLGQYLDLQIINENAQVTPDFLIKLYRLKTGYLFRSAVAISYLINQKKPISTEDKKLNLFIKLGELVGLSFQIQDDIMDYEEEKEKKHIKNYALFVGKDQAIDKLNQVKQQIKILLEQLSQSQTNVQFDNLFSFIHNQVIKI